MDVRKSNGTTKILACRNGVGASCVTLPDGTWRTLAEFLAVRFPAYSIVDWQIRIAAGDVLDDRGNTLLPEMAFKPHSKIFYYRSLPHETRIPFEETILYQDAFIVAVDKPHFLPVIPSGRYLQETLLVRLKRRLAIETLAPMHRIDRDTAGVVLFTVQPTTRHLYHALFQEKRVDKTYQAIAPYRADLDYPFTYRSRLFESRAAFMQMHEIEGVPNSETHIMLMEVCGVFARYKLQPITGQKHQLRAHMAALGMPIVNDRIYPDLHPPPTDSAAPDYSKPLKLLAKMIVFRDPITQEHRNFCSRQVLHF